MTEITIDNPSTLLECALQYCKKGLSVIPIMGPTYTYGETEKEKTDNSKKPLVSWLPYQKERATEAQIREWWHKWPQANVGIVTGAISGITVFDFDSPETVEYFLANPKGETPYDDTPRGGHSFYAYNEAAKTTVKVGGLDIDVRNDGGYVIVPPSINIEGKQYRWIQSILEVPLSPLPDFLKESIKSYNKDLSFSLYNKGCGQIETTQDHNDHTRPQILQQGSRDNDLFRVANCLIKGHAKKDFVFQVLNILAQNCKPPYPEKEIEAKIQSAINRVAERESSISEDVKQWVLTTEGNFITTDCHKDLDLTTKDHKKAAMMALLRLVDEGVIERYGSKRGSYRLIERNAERIDWLNAPDKEFPIDLPLNLSKEAILYPGNVAIFAGSKSSGKTALAFDSIKRNMNRYPVVYLNSEMHATEMKRRLMAHNDITLTAWKFEALSVSHDWADYVTKDRKLFIVDYIETANQDAWKVGGEIKAIHDRLGEGVAIIFLQKKAGEDLARGGQYTLDKARLYVAVDKGKAKIIDAKSFRSENPQGKTLEFKLVQGAIFKHKGEWV